MATCAPTARARAPTVLKLLATLQSSLLAHTVNVRRLPNAGAAVAGTAAAPSRRDAAARAGPARVRPSPRNRPSNCTAAARFPASGTRRSAAGAPAAVRVAVRSANGEACPNVPAADCGTNRYSAESTAEAIDGNALHTASDPGSIDRSAPTP